MLRSGANTGAGRLYRSSVPALTTQSSTSAFSASSAAQPRHFSLLEDRVNKLIKSDNERSIYGGFKGLERETLRVGQDGGLSKSPHPSSFGASMTHPYITTDYSEQMPEFVTPAFNSLPRTLKFLQDTHQFAHGRLSNEKEVLWPCSMPPAVGDDKIIQIADYGRCNAARFKEVYRNALKLRYGARMQIISGIHFNYSLPLPFWDVYQEVEGNTDDLQDFISDSYFGLIRNFLRHTWVVSFLFGASPAVDKSFLDGDMASRFEPFVHFDKDTLYRPYATSLRTGDIGYKNAKQASLNVSYNSLDEYQRTLKNALTISSDEYEDMGLFRDGRRVQLNNNVIQIENEFYSFMRPKRVVKNGDRPLDTLTREGVQYVELRALDVNPFDATGVNETTLRFLEAFMVWCLLRESPKLRSVESVIHEENQHMVASYGRDPSLRITRVVDGEPVKTSVKDWCGEILREMEPICDLLDTKHNHEFTDNDKSIPFTNTYMYSLHLAQACVDNYDLTPSAHILREMRESGESHNEFAMRWAKRHSEWFRRHHLTQQDQLFWSELAGDSRVKLMESEINQADETLEEYIANFFARDGQ